jgi:hypothetical protein
MLRKKVIRFLADVCAVHTDRTGFEIRPDFYCSIPGPISPEVKRPVREVDHSTATTVMFKECMAL